MWKKFFQKKSLLIKLNERLVLIRSEMPDRNDEMPKSLLIKLDERFVLIRSVYCIDIDIF